MSTRFERLFDACDEAGLELRLGVNAQAIYMQLRDEDGNWLAMWSAVNDSIDDVTRFGEALIPLILAQRGA